MSFMVSSSRTMAGARRIAQERMRAIEAERRSIEPRPAPKPAAAAPTVPEPVVAEPVMPELDSPSDDLARRMLRRRGMPDWAIEIVAAVARSHGVPLVDLAGSSRARKIVPVRSEAIYRVKAAKPLTSFPMLGKWFDRDHTSALFAVASYQEATGAPALTRYNVNRARRLKAAHSSHERKRSKERRS